MRNTTWEGPRNGSSTSTRPEGIFSISSKMKTERAHSVRFPCTQFFNSSCKHNEGCLVLTNFKYYNLFSVVNNYSSYLKEVIESGFNHTVTVVSNSPCTHSIFEDWGSAVWGRTGGYMGCSWLNHTDDFPAWS